MYGESIYIKTMEFNMFLINVLTFLASVIGAINLGLVGFFNYNFLNVVFGGAPTGEYTPLTRVIFAIIGLCGLWCISLLSKPALFKSSKKRGE